jgi:phosphohistidine phosphatase
VANVKRLTLVRHAKSDWSLADQPDWDRPLNTRGQRDAPEMGRRLRERKLKPVRILTSPAVRTLSTATILARALRLPADRVQPDERLYLGSPADLLAVIREHGGTARHLMIVGHNPGITEFADRVSGERRIDHMPTCAVVTLQVNLRNWRELDWESGGDVDLDYPRKSS